MNNFEVTAYVSLTLINKGIPKDQADAIIAELWAYIICVAESFPKMILLFCCIFFFNELTLVGGVVLSYQTHNEKGLSYEF